jgi:hypothetical protein
MIHLRAYNESAGPDYREVSEDDIERHMSDNRTDTFTSGEVQALLDFVKATNRSVEVTEFKDKFSIHSINARKLRHYLFSDNPDDEVIREISFPRSSANNIFILDEGSAMQPYMSIDIYKSSEDWFYAGTEIDYETSWFICDGVAGLKSMLTDLFKKREQ